MPPRRSSAPATPSSATRPASGRCRRSSTSTLRPTATSGRCPRAEAASRSSSGSPPSPATRPAGSRSSPAPCSSRATRPASCSRSSTRPPSPRCGPAPPPPSRRRRWRAPEPRPSGSSAAASTAPGRPAASPRSATAPASAPTPRPEAAEALAAELGWRTGSTAEALACDVVVTVTPGDAPVVTADLLRPGTHLAVLGADGHGKAEVEAAAIDRCRLFCDQWEQASTGGELAGPVERGQVGRDDVTDLGAVLAGDARPAAEPTRRSPSSTRPAWRSRTSGSRSRSSRRSAAAISTRRPSRSEL